MRADRAERGRVVAAECRGRRWNRRTALGAGAAAVGWALAGCSGTAARTAAGPSPSNPRTTLVWAPWRVGWGSSWNAVFLDAVQPFMAEHPGVDVQIDIGGSSGSNDTALIPQIIAGTAPDVYSGYGPTKMIEGGYNLDLAPYLKAQNVDTSIFDQGEYSKFVGSNGVWALPAELSTSAVIVNEGMLDDLGVAYPDRSWDYTSAAALWQQVATKSATPGKSRVGFVYWGQKASYLPGDYYLRGWGASAAAANFSTKCGLDSPQALAFAQWWFPLLVDGVIAWNGAALPWPQQVACGFAGSWSLPGFAAQRSVKWDFWPQPAWPQGTTAYAGNDYYAVSATTKNPELAATFAVWLTTSLTWQQALMRLQLVVPPNSKLWPQWVEVVKAIAPPLADKHLDAFTVAPLQNRAFNHPAFAYGSDEAYSTIGTYTGQIPSGKLDPVGAFRQAAAAVDKLESGLAAAAAASSSLAGRFPTNGRPIAPVVNGV